VKASAYSQLGNKGAFLFRRRKKVSGTTVPLVCSAMHCEATFRADNASNGRLTASKACLRPFGGKDLSQILAEHFTLEMLQGK